MPGLMTSRKSFQVSWTPACAGVTNLLIVIPAKAGIQNLKCKVSYLSLRLMRTSWLGEACRGKITGCDFERDKHIDVHPRDPLQANSIKIDTQK